MRHLIIVITLCIMVSCVDLQLCNGWRPLQSGEGFDGYFKYNGEIYLGDEPDTGAPPLENVDLATFSILQGTGYARDKNRVYYPISIMCVDGEDYAYCYAEKYEVNGANPKCFKYLGNDYATDGKLVFFRGELVLGADGSSVVMNKGPEFFYSVKDAKHVFIYNKILNNADPRSFHYWKDESPNKYNHHYLLKDSKHVWFFDPPEWPILLDNDPEDA